MKYVAHVRFIFTDDKSKDSEKFVVVADSKEEAFYKAFKTTMMNWDEQAVAITSIELA